MTAPPASTIWAVLCRIDDLLIERGSAALMDGIQIALFRTYTGAIFATQQQDPYSGAAVMARGIVGDLDGAPTVASPMYKQIFDLRTGVCLETQGKDRRDLRTYPVAVREGNVLVKGRRP